MPRQSVPLQLTVEQVSELDPALPADAVLEAGGFRILEVRPINWFGYWTLIEAEVVK